MNTFYERIDKLAHRLLDRSQALALPVNLEVVVDFLGLNVLIRPLEDEYSGFLAVAEKTIVVNSHHAPVRRRFTVAHEIGHYQLHRRKKIDSPVFIDKKVYFRRASGDDSHRWEVQANVFATGLLMPEFLLEEYLDKHPDVDLSQTAGIKQMADEFEVSRQAMDYRLRNLGFLLPTSF